jgi:hypothetical protein
VAARTQIDALATPGSGTPPLLGDPTSQLSSLLHLWHLTSLDAPTVAVVWTLAFAWAFGIHLPLWVPMILALGAWSVYIGDRLLDAWRARSPLRARHHFHWHHRRIFVAVALVAFCVAMALILRYMPLAARGRNSILAAAAFVYFTGVHSRSDRSNAGTVARRFAVSFPGKFPVKELLVAIIFTLACAAPTWARTTAHLAMLAPILGFAALAWLNCHAIETWETASEPITRLLAKCSSTLRTATLLAIVTIAASAISAALHHPRPAALLAAAALSAVLLGILDRHQHRLSAITLRAAADLVLLTPLALLALR